MGNLRISEWRKLPVSLTELCINTTLRCGQSFRWKKSPEGDWSCALHGRILTLRQDQTHLHYRSISPSRTSSGLLTPCPSSPGSIKLEDADITTQPQEDDDDTEALLHRYFNLSTDLTSLYAAWSRADSNFRRRAPAFTGIRILRQDAWEALVGFICSSNNNIARISQMVDKLCARYGTLIGHVQGEPYFDFPAPEALTGDGVEAELRMLGFGYRAGYLWRTAVVVAQEREEGWLEGLRNPEDPRSGFAGDMPDGGREGYRIAHEALLQLQGVGPKVADCVCLMGLGWGEAVPVDTHVYQIAHRDYAFPLSKHKTLTQKTYDAIGNKFRKLWGTEAGWAHSVLFTADLRIFKEVAREVKEEVVGVKMEGLVGVKMEEEEERQTIIVKATSNRKKSKNAESTTTTITTLSVKTETPAIPPLKRDPSPSATHDNEFEDGDMMTRIKRRRRKVT